MKTKTLVKSIVFCTISIYSMSIHAQISTNELPPSFSTTLFSVRSSDVIELPIPNVAEAQHEDSLFAGADIPYRVGLPIPVDCNLQNSGVWQTVGDTIKVWRLQLRAAGAKAMTISYDKFWLPEGAKFFVYNADKSFCIGAFTSLNNKGVRDNPVDFATGFVAGDNIVLEYYEPIGAIAGVISIQRAVYVYKNILVAQSNITRGVTPGSSQSCNVNINCQQGVDWQKEKRAVAAIYDSKGALCTGSLINNTENKDYFLSANHCFVGYDAQGANQLNQLIFYWNYESPDCSNSYNLNPLSSAGATLLANNAYSDFALLELTEAVRYIGGRYTPFYLGWASSSIPATNATCIHHPRGDIKKISIDTNPVENLSTEIFWSDGSTSLPNTHWSTTFDLGIVEGGSSGSPLLDQNHRIVGQLHGGKNHICGSTIVPKYYGRFDKSWNYGTTATRRLRDWLDPNNTGLTQMCGKGTDDIVGNDIVGDKYVCNNSVYYLNNLPDNMTVVWECNSSVLTLLANSPSVNQCTLKNESTNTLNAVLTAKVMKGNEIIAMFSKNIEAIRPSLSGYYRQETCVFHDIRHPEIPTTDINKETARFVHQGCMVYLTLYGIGTRRVSHSGITPDVWHYNGSTQIQFRLPLGSGGIPFYVEIGDDGSCAKQRFLFFTVSNNGNISQKRSSGNPKEISIIPSQFERTQNIPNWSLEVYDTFCGTKVCDVKNLTKPSYQLNTSEWVPGEYVIRVVMGDEVFTDKLTVEK